MQDICVFITGAGGYVGGETVKVLAQEYPYVKIIASDIVPAPEFYNEINATYEQADIRNEERINTILNTHNINVVVHLAAALPARDGLNRKFEYSVNVTGTNVIMDACLKNNIRKIIISSSGAAYGYHADNDSCVKEDHPLRGNKEFPYSDQKRMIEEMLSEYRVNHPELKQVIFRLSATIGSNVKNQISEFFEMPMLFGIKGYDSPFAFILDRDVVNCIVKAIIEDKEGIYNLTADGKIPMKHLAKMMNKKYVPVPEGVFKFALKYLQKMKIVPWGPEQASFIKYRLVMDNRSLKEDFGYIPQKNSQQVFEFYLNQRS